MDACKCDLLRQSDYKVQYPHFHIVIKVYEDNGNHYLCRARTLTSEQPIGLGYLHPFTPFSNPGIRSEVVIPAQQTRTLENLMRKLLLLFLTSLIIASITFWDVYSQGDQTTFISVQFTNEGITFYAPTPEADGILEPIANLPSNFGLADLNPSAEWIIASPQHLVSSPDFQQIAFTAESNQEVSLFTQSWIAVSNSFPLLPLPRNQFGHQMVRQYCSDLCFRFIMLLLIQN